MVEIVKVLPSESAPTADSDPDFKDTEVRNGAAIVWHACEGDLGGGVCTPNVPTTANTN